MKAPVLFVLMVILAMGCNAPKTSDSASETDTQPTYALSEVWRTDTILKTCESVLYDGTRQQLFVSCINGMPSDKDGKGFIALLDPKGKTKELEWVTGLDAPKGMAVQGNSLIVTNIDELVMIDIEEAQIVERIPVPGSSFLNDVAVGMDGTIYFTDSDKGIVWALRDGELKEWVNEGLGRPNGLYIEKDRVLLTSSASQDLRIIDKETAEYEIVTTEIGHGDGIEFTGTEGHYVVSSWSGEVFLILPDYSKISLLKTSDQEINSADIGFNIQDQVVYVPTFFDNRVVAYKLEQNAE